MCCGVVLSDVRCGVLYLVVYNVVFVMCWCDVMCCAECVEARCVVYDILLCGFVCRMVQCKVWCMVEYVVMCVA